MTNLTFNDLHKMELSIEELNAICYVLSFPHENLSEIDESSIESFLKKVSDLGLSLIHI